MQLGIDNLWKGDRARRNVQQTFGMGASNRNQKAAFHAGSGASIESAVSPKRCKAVVGQYPNGRSIPLFLDAANAVHWTTVVHTVLLSRYRAITCSKRFVFRSPIVRL
jgi:hypothetical protein